MRNPYEDILHLPYTGSRTHKRMSMINRGAQFSPFAALTGYDAAIQETGRLTQQFVDLDVDAIAEVDEKLKVLRERQEDAPQIKVTYFVPDEKKNGGAYALICGRVKQVESDKKAIVLTDGKILWFYRIYDITGDIF